MNKLRPILQGSPSKMERLLLSSSQLDMPPSNVKKRAFSLLGMGGSVIATTQITGVATATAAAPATAVATAAAATGTGAVAATGATTGVALTLLKGLAIGAVTGTITYGSLTVYREHRQTTPVPAQTAPVQTMTPQRSWIETNGSKHASTPLEVAQVQQPVTVSARQPPKSARADNERARQMSSVATNQPTLPKEQSSLKSERATIELAHTLVRGGDPAAALLALSEHQRRYPKPQLGPEAMLVRIEALRRLGQSSDAQRLGLQFLAAQPDGPYAQRVRSLLDLPAAH